jgi:hypothetical protein
MNDIGNNRRFVDASFSQSDSMFAKMIYLSVAVFVVWMLLKRLRHRNGGRGGGGKNFSPPNIEQIGRGSWTLLHTMAARYPRKPSRKEQDDMNRFLRTFAKMYPCDHCSEDMTSYLQRRPPDCRNRDALHTWICELHNHVNEKLGKSLMNCQDASALHRHWIGGDGDDGVCRECK